MRLRVAKKVLHKNWVRPATFFRACRRMLRKVRVNGRWQRAQGIRFIDGRFQRSPDKETP